MAICRAWNSIPHDSTHLSRAVYCDFLNGCMAFSISQAAAETGQRIRQSLRPPHRTPHGIYVARTDASQRRMRNETAMIELAQNSGLDVIIPGNLSFEHQVAAFAAAKLVVGAHGAGLSNIAYCSPGTIIYELVPSHYPNPCFRAIADQNNLVHWADAFASDGNGPPVIRDWEADLTAVGVRLLELDAYLAGRS